MRVTERSEMDTTAPRSPIWRRGYPGIFLDLAMLAVSVGGILFITFTLITIEKIPKWNYSTEDRFSVRGRAIATVYRSRRIHSRVSITRQVSATMGSSL